MPKWNPKSLQNHFNKRVSKDAACLQDVLGRPVSSITEEDYERESMKVLSTAWICYSGEGLDNRGSGRGGIAYYDAANHFVDDRLLTTIVSRSTDVVLTCYHEDFNRSHRTVGHKIEQMVRYVEHLGNQRRGNMLRNFSVERFAPPSGAPTALEAELGRVKAIQEKSAPAA
jgi:hypothetical protein